MTGSTKQNRGTILIGIAGGSGSGKTYFAQALCETLNARAGRRVCEILYQDSYYIDQSAKFDFDGGAVNFDHPSSLDFDLLCEHLRLLKRGNKIEVPIYDFVSHSRSRECVPTDPMPIVLVDGILIFHPENVRGQFDDLVFFDTPEELRFQRRLDRDVHERGRTPDGVKTQFLRQVKPMHDQFVEPTKAFAKTIVADVGDYDSNLLRYVEHLLELIERN